jgi:hypothetical protein
MQFKNGSTEGYRRNNPQISFKIIFNTFNIKILFWNASGIRNKIEEFYNYLESNHIHVACLNETFLKPHLNIRTHPDYEMHRFDRTNKNKGGLLIFVRKMIKHSAMNGIKTDLLETLGIEIETSNHSKIQIINTYLPGGSTVAEINRSFLDDIRKITRRTKSFFAVGDFNSRHRFWNCERANPAGTILYNEYSESNFLILHPPNPTHFPNGNVSLPSTIDLAITNGLHQCSEPKTVQMNSDHCAVQFEILLNHKLNLEDPRLVPCFRLANWENFRRIIESRININVNNFDIESIQNTNEIDEMVEKLQSTIIHAQNKSIPLVHPEKHSITLTPDIIEMIQLRNRLRRQWQRSRIASIKSDINYINNRIAEKVLRLKNMNWNFKLSNIPKSHVKLWQTTRILKIKDKHMPSLKSGSDVKISPEEKANALADHFEKTHENPLAQDSPKFTAKLNEHVEEYFTQNQTVNDIDFPTPEETFIHIKSLKKSKAPGMDRIHNVLIKQLPWKAIVYLNFIIMCCLKLSYFPTNWKTAKVIPLAKPGKDPHLLSSYRPISLLNSLSKILEKIILTRIKNHLSAHDIIPPEQYGFQNQKSTTHQLYRIINLIKSQFNNKCSSTAMILLDVEKAFDRVWHSGLIYKMIKFKFPPYIIKFIKDFLKDRKFHVSVKNKMSIIKLMAFGLPQGSVLSPTLYNIFTADIPKDLYCMLSLFADDTGILCTSPSFKIISTRLENYLEVLKKYYRRWKIKINKEKTQAIYFTRRRTKELPNGPINIFGENIEWSKEVKYLGVILDKTLTLGQHIQHAVEKVGKAVRILYPLLNRRSDLNNCWFINKYYDQCFYMLVHFSKTLQKLTLKNYKSVKIESSNWRQTFHG